jgi:hypothetical protein
MAETNILGDLLVKIRGDLKDLETALDKAQTSSETTSKKIEKDFKASFDKISQDAKKVSDALSKYVTLPILASGAAAIKFASDVAESTNAVNVVFKDSAKVITDWGKNSAKQAGLFSADFNQAAATVGAQLINTGSATKEAADQTILLTQRAADMASIFNTDVNTALQAIQSQLRGESEPIRKFAISIDEAAVNAKALALGLVDAKGEVTTYGKAQARVALILEQTAKFQGDFVNTSDEFENGLRVTTALAKEQAAEFGKQLLPTMNDLVQSSGKLLEGLSNLSDTQRKNIITIAGFSAALGPAIAAVNGISKAIVAMNAALLSNPIVLATTALVALGATAVLVNNNIKGLQEQKKVLDKLLAGGTTGSYVKDLELVNKEIENVNAQIAGSTGLFENENAELQAQLAILQKARTEIAMKVQGQRAVNDGKKTETVTNEKLAKSAEARARIEEQYRNSRKEVLEILEGEKSEYQKLQEQIEALEKTPWASGQLESERLAAIEALHARQKQILVDEEKDIQDRYQTEFEAQLKASEAYDNASNDRVALNTRLRDEFANSQKSTTQIELEEIEKRRQAFIDAGISEVDANKNAQTQILQTYIGVGQNIVSTLQGVFSQIQSLYNQDAQNRIDAINYALESDLQAIDARMQAELEAAGLSEATTIESLQKKLDAALAQGELVTAEELRQEIAKAEIKEKYDKEKQALEKKAALDTYKVQISAFKTNQQLSKYQAVITAAEGAIAAYKALAGIPIVGPGLGLAAALAFAGFAKKQVEIIDNQVPPSPPALANGGEIGANNPTLAVIGDNTRYNEVVAPLSPDTFAKIADGILVALASRARPSGVTENTAGSSTMYGSGSSSGSSMTVNAGIIVANDAGLRAFARVITPYLHEESVRIG